MTLSFRINEDKLRFLHRDEAEVRFDIASTLIDTREHIMEELYKAFAALVVEETTKGN